MTTSKPTTFAPLCEAFIASLIAAGKSASTAKSYAGDLNLAKKHFGESTPLTKLTTKAVEDYFASDPVNLTRKGTLKNKITTDKIKRVFRLAMVWAEDEGLIKEAPLPTPPKKEKKPTEPKPTATKPPVLKKPAKAPKA
jgi:site-specific recombinase XerD